MAMSYFCKLTVNFTIYLGTKPIIDLWYHLAGHPHPLCPPSPSKERGIMEIVHGKPEGA